MGWDGSTDFTDLTRILTDVFWLIPSVCSVVLTSFVFFAVPVNLPPPLQGGGQGAVSKEEIPDVP